MKVQRYDTHKVRRLAQALGYDNPGKLWEKSNIPLTVTINVFSCASSMTIPRAYLDRLLACLGAKVADIQIDAPTQARRDRSSAVMEARRQYNARQRCQEMRE